MTAATLKLEIEQGSTFRYALELKAGTAANAPALDLTGYVARMQIRADQAAATVLHEMTSANGGITIDALAGRLNLLISATATAAFAFDRAVYDLEIESAGGEVTRVIQGTVVLSREVTR